MIQYRYFRSETDFLIKIFTENGRNTNIATECLQNINKPKRNNQNNTKNTKKHHNITMGTNSWDSYPGVYALNCSCKAEYISETKKKRNHQNNWTPKRQHKEKTEKLTCDGTLFKMSLSIQLMTSKDIIQKNKI